MTSEDLTTKEKILEAANDLFAEKGFAATSIREIATQADVNLASINYHFKNKENLYWKVFDHNYEHMEQRISKIGDSTKSTEQLAIEVFRFFMSGKSAIMNTFKIFLSDSVAVPEGHMEQDDCEKFGPPGQMAFLEKIKDEAPGASDASKRWAMKMIFALLVHYGVIMHTATMKAKCQEDDELKPENLEVAIAHSIKAHLHYLKLNPNIF